MALGVTEVQSVHHHADIRGIFPRLPDVGDLDQFEGGFVEAALESLVTIKIAVGLFHYNVSLEEQPLDYLANLESRELRFVRADRNVFQIKKYRHGGIGLRSAHWLGHVNGQCRGKASDGAKPAVGPEGRSWPHRLNT